MELSSEILESLVMDNKDVMEVLKDGSVTEEDIIFESEATEDSEEAEIEEIIEIIEEVEEDETTADGDISLEDKDKTANTKDGGTVERTEKNDQVTKKNIELYSFDEENSVLASQSPKKDSAKNTNSSTRKTNKQVITYDVDEDWQDEELERIDELDNTSELAGNCADSLQIQADKKHVNNQTISLQSNKIDLRITVDSMKRSDKSRPDSDIGNNINNIEDDNETTHEIVKNIENNLVYTVLGTKKQDSSKQQQEKLNDAHYVKVSISY